MGYTHYYRRAKVLDQDKFTRAVEDCRKVVGTLGVELRYEHDSDEPAVFLPKMVRYNGVEGQGHETFLIEQTYAPPSWNRPMPEDAKSGHELWFDFCKTARKPYDAAVCACLIIFSHHFGGDFIVSSDGDNDEENWPVARAACQDALGYGEGFRLRE